VLVFLSHQGANGPWCWPHPPSGGQHPGQHL